MSKARDRRRTRTLLLLPRRRIQRSADGAFPENPNRWCSTGWGQRQSQSPCCSGRFVELPLAQRFNFPRLALAAQIHENACCENRAPDDLGKQEINPLQICGNRYTSSATKHFGYAAEEFILDNRSVGSW